MDNETAEKAIEVAQDLMGLLKTNHYHNYSHAENVAETAVELAEEEGLSEEATRCAEVAAWFHDVGYIVGSENHESVGAGMARHILSGLGANEGPAVDVAAAIRATEVPQENTSNVVAQVVADADLACLGYAYHDFYQGRMEAYREFNPDMTPREWHQRTSIELLQYQYGNYMTDAAEQRWQKQLETNYQYLQREVEEGSPDVLVGGTFDMIHAGHMELLRTAFGHGNVTVGLTSQELAEENRDREVRGFETRKGILDNAVAGLVSFFNREYTIEKLEDRTGAAVESDADILVISPEEKVKKRAEAINEERSDAGRDELEIIVSEEVTADDGSRISSTRIANDEISCTGKVL